jgi:hypothetical protein
MQLDDSNESLRGDAHTAVLRPARRVDRDLQWHTVMYFSPARRDLAERYATDPDYQQSRVTKKKAWENNVDR